MNSYIWLFQKHSLQNTNLIQNLAWRALVDCLSCVYLCHLDFWKNSTAHRGLIIVCVCRGWRQHCGAPWLVCRYTVCVQFHWWDYKDKRYLDTLGHLADLQQEGSYIRQHQRWMTMWFFFLIFRGFRVYRSLSAGELSLTNFDTHRMKEITNRGIWISSNQVAPPPPPDHHGPLFSSVFGVCPTGSVLCDWPASCCQDGAVLSGQQHQASHLQHPV